MRHISTDILVKMSVVSSRKESKCEIWEEMSIKNEASFLSKFESLRQKIMESLVKKSKSWYLDENIKDSINESYVIREYTRTRKFDEIAKNKNKFKTKYKPKLKPKLNN